MQNIYEQGLVYMLGSDGTADADFNTTAEATGAAISRHRFNQHHFHRAVKSGGAGDPTVKIQGCLVPEDQGRAEIHWFDLATLNNAAPHFKFERSAIYYFRAKRSDSSTTGIQVIVSSNDE